MDVNIPLKMVLIGIDPYPGNHRHQGTQGLLDCQWLRLASSRAEIFPEIGWESSQAFFGAMFGSENQVPGLVNLQKTMENHHF